tara:strand:- start:632 stop:763 length:132 start_codon:yes stop_codon:yes gene_type:complete
MPYHKKHGKGKHAKKPVKRPRKRPAKKRPKGILQQLGLGGLFK